MARRNFLFSGSGNGARASCFIKGLLQTLYTDWEKIRKHIADEVKGLVLPAKDALELFRRNEDEYKGIVINPDDES